MISRRDLFLRAHQLVAWNGNTVREVGRAAAFARFLRAASAEAKAGKLASFAPEAVKVRAIQSVKDAIVFERNRPCSPSAPDRSPMS